MVGSIHFPATRRGFSVGKARFWCRKRSDTLEFVFVLSLCSSGDRVEFAGVFPRIKRGVKLSKAADQWQVLSGKNASFFMKPFVRKPLALLILCHFLTRKTSVLAAADLT
jgi:hypothetical protein